jgi:hypothetical protein
MPEPRSLKEQLAAEIAAAEALDPARYRGLDWYHLTDEEEFVFFDIDRDRFPRMVTVWSCYDAFKLYADAPTWSEDLIAKARAASRLVRGRSLRRGVSGLRQRICGASPSAKRRRSMLKSTSGISALESHDSAMN